MSLEYVATLKGTRDSLAVARWDAINTADNAYTEAHFKAVQEETEAANENPVDAANIIAINDKEYVVAREIADKIDELLEFIDKGISKLK